MKLFLSILDFLLKNWVWTLIVFAAIGIISAATKKTHRHYCDTCKHGIWNRGQCYCETKRQMISNIQSHAGCRSWVSRR